MTAFQIVNTKGEYLLFVGDQTGLINSVKIADANNITIASFGGFNDGKQGQSRVLNLF